MKRVVAFLMCVVLVLTVFTSCSDGKKTEEFFAMDTFVQLTLYGGGKAEISSVRSEIENTENKYSISGQGSLVYRLNLGETVERDAGLLEMLALSKKMTEISGGAYDLTVRPVLELYGFGGENRVPTDEEISETLKKVGFSGISVLDNGIKLSEGVKIDLGSCAKGYAGDRVIKYLGTTDIECAVLSIGGSVHTYGKKPNGAAFNIAISDPNEPTKAFAYVDVGECAVVTSGVYQRYFEVDGVRYHHLLDATTGKCSQSDLLSVTVIVDYQDQRAGMKADFLSSCMFLLGSEEALKYQKTVGGFEAVMVTASGEVILTDGIADKITFSNENQYTVKK